MSSVQSSIRRFRVAPAPADILTDPIAGFVYPKILSAELTDGVATYERTFLAQDHDHFANVRGEKTAALKFDTELIGFGGGGAGDGVVAGEGENGLLAKSVFGAQVRDTGSNVAAGATAASIAVAADAGFTPGGFVGVMLNGAFHARQIRSKAAGALAACRALPGAPAAAAVAFASAWYRHAAYGHQHLWFDLEGVDLAGAGNWRRYLRGCLGNVELVMEVPAKLRWSFEASDWHNADGVAQPAPVYPPGLPEFGMVVTRSTKVWIDDALQVVTSFGFTLGNDVQRKPSIASPTGAAGFHVPGAARTFELTVLHDDGGAALAQKAQEGGYIDLLVEGTQGGPGNSLAIAAPVCELSSVERTSVNGLDAYKLTGRVLRADLDPTLPAGFPDVAIGFL